MAVSAPTRSTIWVGPIIQVVMERPSDHEKREDIVRGLTTLAFIVIFGGTVLLSFWAVTVYNKLWTSGVKDLVQLMLSIETALIGTALGFYFGTKTTTTTDS